MGAEKRLKILTEAEIGDLLGPPVLNHNDQRFFFTLNDHELAIAHKIRRRDQRYVCCACWDTSKLNPLR